MGMWSRVKAGSQEPGKGLPLSSTENMDSLAVLGVRGEPLSRIENPC